MEWRGVSGAGVRLWLVVAAVGAAPALAQVTAPNEWTWMGGSDVLPTCEAGAPYCTEPGVYGMLKMPDTGNGPGGRTYATTWTDGSGNLWLFGGSASVASTTSDVFNDLWEYNPSTGEWAWMSGASTVGTDCVTESYGTFCGYAGTYGNLGSFESGNTPGSRSSSLSWIDTSGHLWLFGGEGFDSAGNWGFLNDVWEFDPGTDEWAWRGGSETMTCVPTMYNGNTYMSCGEAGVYGTLKKATAGSIPGGRIGGGEWTDSSGNFWLYGGSGYDANGNDNNLSDVWKFTPSSNQWIWMSGSDAIGTLPAAGTPRKFAAGNTPGGRQNPASWTDLSGNFWLFGGAGLDDSYNFGYFDDLWKYDPAAGEWAQMSGSSSLTGALESRTGVFGTLGVAGAANVPGGRAWGIGWTDTSGNLWLFGGFALANCNPEEYFLNDLWKFNPTSNEWAWMGGSQLNYCAESSASGLVDAPGVYGDLGTAAAGDVPGSRYGMVGWTGAGGNFWLFGGAGWDADNVGGALNDLWEYQPSTGPLPAAAKPELSVAMGVSSQTVTMSDGTNGSTIYYTTDGSTPTTSSAVYTGPITVTPTEVVEAIATASGCRTSPVAEVKVPPMSQTITFAAIAAQPVFSTVTLLATASSGLAVTFVTSTPSVCSVSGNTAMLLGTGTCAVIAEQAGNSDYLAAANVGRNIAVVRAAQTITFAAVGTQTALATVNLGATASSGLAVTYSSMTTGVCTVSGSEASLLAHGTCTIKASQGGNSDYLGAANVTQSFTVSYATQTINFPAIAAQPVNTTVTLSATASSGLPVTFVTSTPAVCSVSGDQATLLTTGYCGVVARQAGNGAYSAAANVGRNIHVVPAS